MDNISKVIFNKKSDMCKQYEYIFVECLEFNKKNTVCEIECNQYIDLYTKFCFDKISFENKK